MIEAGSLSPKTRAQTYSGRSAPNSTRRVTKLFYSRRHNDVSLVRVRQARFVVGTCFLRYFPVLTAICSKSLIVAFVLRI